MSNHLINTAMSGLYAAQTGLGTVSNNIANAFVAGYSRQNAILGQSSGTSTQSGFIGNGVAVNGINREYNEFIANQLRTAQTQNSASASYYQQISQVDNLFASKTNGLSATMQDFFNNLQNLVSNANDDAARQTVLGKAEGLVNQFQSYDKYLRDLDSGINRQIGDSVAKINGYSQQIAKLNDQITRLRGNGSEPNALLDQRDQLVSELNQIVSVSVSKQDGGVYDISFTNGLSLVQGTTAHRLEAIPSSSDPSRVIIGYNNGIGGVMEVPAGHIAQGSLGGVLKFRTESLDSVRNQLGQIALTMAYSFNEQHKQGYDLQGDSGLDFFSYGDPGVVTNTRNAGDAQLQVAYTDIGSVRASDYRVESDGSGGWQVIRLSDSAMLSPQTTTSADGRQTLSFDGLAVSVSGNPQKEDSFILKPVSNAAAHLQVALKSAGQIAAAGEPEAGESDNRNAQALLDLQGEKLVEGRATLAGAYAGLVSDIGNRTSAAGVNQKAQSNIVEQLALEQQSVSGVNMEEEFVELQRFQQYYLANAQVIQTASAIFNALLSIRG